MIRLRVLGVVLTAILLTGCLGPRPFVYDRERVSDYLHDNPDVPGDIVKALMDGRVVKGMTRKEVILCLGKPTKKDINTLYGRTTEIWFYSRPVQQEGGLERSRMWHKEIPLARVLFGYDGRVTHCQMFGVGPPPDAQPPDRNANTSAEGRMGNMQPPPPPGDDRMPPPSWVSEKRRAFPRRPTAANAPTDAPAPHPRTDTDWPGLDISGISSGGNTPTAIINRRVVAKGETVSGVKVLDINGNGVLLKYGEDIQFHTMPPAGQ